MPEVEFERPDISEESPEAPKPGIPQAPASELAEGLDKDPRLGIIRKELIENWKQSTGKDILSAEGQDFQFGDITARQRGEKPTTLDERAQEVFAGRFPDDAKAYVEKEQTRVYENPADDPAIKDVEERITTTTNRDVRKTQRGMWGDDAAREASGRGYGGVWDKNFNRVRIQEWDKFLSRYPEKAMAYRDKFEPVKRALEGEERLRQYREQQAAREQERVNTVDDNLEPRDFIDNPRTGLDAADIEQPIEAAVEASEAAQSTEAVEEATRVGVEPSEAERSFAQRISDFEVADELRRSMGQEPEQKSEEEQGEDLSRIFSTFRKPHRFQVDSGTANQRTIEVKPIAKSTIITETDYHGNSRRWEVPQKGAISLVESGYGYHEEDVSDRAGGSVMKQRVPEMRTINKFGHEAMDELEKLLKKFADQIKEKTEAR